MSHRGLTTALICVALGVTPAAAQDAPPRTPWGDPDLQGIWNSKTQTPLERPDQYAGREFLTEEEVAALERQTFENPGRDERAERGTVADVEGAYNNIFSTFFATKVVATGRTSLIVNPSDGKIPYTAEARTRVADDAARRRATRDDATGPEDRPSDRCLGLTLPCTSPLCAFSRIVQSPDVVTLYYEAGHWGGVYRTIALDGRPHLPSHVRQWFGDSLGRWEGDTLVVDTTNFTNRTSSMATFIGANENLHLVERFTLVNPDRILYEATIEEPMTFTQPWTIEMTWARGEDQQNQIFESACHEGNYALTSILAGARAVEGAK